MDIDFEKIRLETLDKYLSSFHSDDKIANGLITQFARISSEISKAMLIKYHEELNKSKD